MFLAKFEKYTGYFFIKKGSGKGVFGKIRKVPGYFFDDDSVGRVGGGQET